MERIRVIALVGDTGYFAITRHIEFAEAVAQGFARRRVKRKAPARLGPPAPRCLRQMGDDLVQKNLERVIIEGMLAAGHQERNFVQTNVAQGDRCATIPE